MGKGKNYYVLPYFFLVALAESSTSDAPTLQLHVIAI
jgi:hypothetical protein